MKKMINELSVFFPAYNEEANIKTIVKKAKDVLLKIADKWEIIIVNDGSKDNTLKIAERLSADDRRIRVVSHKVNKGYGSALKSGFAHARYGWVAFTDADGQFDFSEITRLLEKKNKADLVLGYRLNRADPFIRKVYTFVWSVLIPNLLWGLGVKDYSCGFKLIKKNVFESVQPLAGEEKVTQIELLVKAKKLGFKFAQVGVHHYPREFGRQTGANFKVVMRSLIDLVKLWWKLR